MPRIAPIVLVVMLLAPCRATADQIALPLPLDVPASIDLLSNPIVTFGPRTIDFTTNLDQEFIAFLPFVTPLGDGVFRNTIGVRARDGLATLSGTFPVSGDPTFTNQVPTFLLGTTNLLAFDLIVPGWGTPFSVALSDRDGTQHTADFANPVPEPGTLVLIGTGLGLLARARRRRGANGEP